MSTHHSAAPSQIGHSPRRSADCKSSSARAAISIENNRMNEGFVELEGRRLWVRDSGGSGPVLMLLHARSGSSLFWEKQFPVFTGAGFRVVAYDRVGHGRSTLA